MTTIVATQSLGHLADYSTRSARRGRSALGRIYLTKTGGDVSQHDHHGLLGTSSMSPITCGWEIAFFGFCMAYSQGQSIPATYHTSRYLVPMPLECDYEISTAYYSDFAIWILVKTRLVHHDHVHASGGLIHSSPSDVCALLSLDLIDGKSPAALGMAHAT